MIDYAKLVHAQEFYTDRGYDYTEAPWFVSIEAMQATFVPKDRKEPLELRYVSEVPVASGEQSLVHMLLKGDQPKGRKFQTITPCFRDEPIINETHRKFFMKLELMHLSNSVYDLEQMIDCAFKFFNQYTFDHNRDALKIVSTAYQTYDIEFEGIELGSYGIRRHDHIGPWIYGTGVAEPRFSVALNKFLHAVPSNIH